MIVISTENQTFCVYPTAGTPGRHTCINCGRIVTTKARGQIRTLCSGGPYEPPVRRLGTAEVPCLHRGKVIDKVRCELCGDHETMLDVHECALHGKCTIRHSGKTRSQLPNCSGCADRKPETPKIVWEWISTERLITDTKLLAAKLPPDISGVAGIPRSGMMPASVLAAFLQVPLYQLTEQGQLERLGHGYRGRVLGFAKGAGRLLIVDDTVHSGAAMRKAYQGLREQKVVRAAVYVLPGSEKNVDVFTRSLSAPHLLEWNIVNSGPFGGQCKGIGLDGGVAVDFDGILCHDRESGGQLGGPYLVPRTLSVKLIATGRHEQHRGLTEAWLKQWHVPYDQIAMMSNDGPQADDPGYIDAVIKHKAKQYIASGCSLFIESCPRQAEAIFKLTGRPVACPIAAKIWS